MSQILAALSSLIGRVCLSLIFLMSAVGNKIPKFNEVAGYMAAEGVPMPSVALAGAIVFLIAGSLSLIVGYYARVGAFLLLIFLILATYYFHDFWTYEGKEQQDQMIQFMKNLALMGAMIMIIGNGPGAASLDAWFGPTDAKKRKGDF